MVKLDPNKTYSFREFHDLFPDDLTCRKYLEGIRWNGKPQCPRCESEKVTPLNGMYVGKRFNCNNKGCRTKFSVTVGTIFENTKIPLPVWFCAIYSMSINKKNISSVQMSINLGITQTSAWQMCTKLRSLYADKRYSKLSGTIEIDEAYISKGTFNSWYRMGRKTPVIGMKQRNGEVRIFSVQNKNRDTMQSLIRDNVEEGAKIYTDGCKSYVGLHKWYEHDSVNHKEREWVSDENPDVHTQNIENVWSRFKKSIRGANHSVSQKHLQKYCDEAAYRINYCHLTPVEKFNDLLIGAVNVQQKCFKREE